MINTDWNRLSALQLGAFAEHYVQMVLLSYGMDVYPSIVDDHAVDLVIKDCKGEFREIQVKSVFKSKYTFVRKCMMCEREKEEIKDDYYWCLVHFIQGELPRMYIIPGSAWKEADGVLFVDRNYEDKKSLPEYGVNITQKSLPLLQKYEITSTLVERYFGKDK